MPNNDKEAQTGQIMQRLRKKTKDCHAKLESKPYFTALIEHKLPLDCYVNQLRALSIIHGVLENEIATAENETLKEVWNDNLRKIPLLEKDLSFFEPRVIPDADSPIQSALEMARKIRMRQMENPVTLLGYLYVLEGSTLGNSMHRPDISKTFHLDGLNGCRYYASYRDQVRSRWKLFSDTMNHALKDPSPHDAVIEAAHEAFSGLEMLYEALYPLQASQKEYHVTRINPEAGNHPMPEDKREIQAALKASDRGWAEFGYYEQRFGNRGKRFSDSDTCWLVTLTRLDQEILQQQLDWLCRVLATRGMPTIMMEHTLRFLHEELKQAVPEKKADYDKLHLSAEYLKKMRERWIDGPSFQSLTREFEQSVDAGVAKTYRNTGRLLVSAVADEANGIDGAVDTIWGWLTDSDRFPIEWIRAVKKTVDRAKNQAAQ